MAPADTLVCDTAQVAAWQSDPAFAYSRELIAPEINVLEWFSRWFGKLLDKIFGNTLVAEYSEVVLICIAVLILVLVIWFVYKKRPELFMRSRKWNSLWRRHIQPKVSPFRDAVPIHPQPHFH